MTTMGTIKTDHFRGGRNTNTGQREGSDATADELLAQAKVDIAALEARNTILETANTAIQTAPTLAAAAEAADVIAITFTAPVASVEQYVVEALDAATMTPLITAFTCAETDVGSEVSPTARPALIFKTDSGGGAEISVTDVVGASGKTVWVMFRPLFEQADVAQQCAPAAISITFD